MAGAHYNLIRKIGTGGMAEVWKAQAADSAGGSGSAMVAVKRLLPSLSASSEAIEMLLEEARLVAALEHPNIVQVIDFGHDDRDWYIAMEYVAGVNLNDLLKRATDRGMRIPFEVALHVALECCKALGFAHASTDDAGRTRKLVHRDVSPHNMLLAWDGAVKLTDFGIAKVAQSVSRTQVGVVRGKAAYLSPEQMASQPLDRRSDLFSLGLVLFELLSGRRFFDAMNLSKLLDQIHSFIEPGDEISIFPRDIREILKHVLQRDRDLRYGDAREMEAALTRVLGPDGAAEAPEALAKILGKLFAEERRLDETEASVAWGEPTTPGFERTHVGAPEFSAADQPSFTPSRDSAGEVTLTSSLYAPDPRAGAVATIPASPPAAGASMTGSPARATREVDVPASATAAAAAASPPFDASWPVPPAARASGLLRTRGRQAAALALLAIVVGGGVGLAAAMHRQHPGAIAHATPVHAEGTASGTPADAHPTSLALAHGDATRATAFAVASPSLATSASPVAPAPSAQAAASPAATRLADRSTPAPAPSAPEAKTGDAHIWVSARPWVRVLVDGTPVADETPLTAWSIPPGFHTLRFENPIMKFHMERSLTLHAGEKLDLFVDTTADPSAALTIKSYAGTD